MSDKIPTLHRFKNAESIAQAVADLLIQRFERPAGPRALMLSGGRTPMAAYAEVAAHAPAVAPEEFVFLSDERFVPSDSGKNNQKKLAPLYSALKLEPSQVLTIETDGPLPVCVQHFEAGLEQWIQKDIVFDLGLLGMGADGHTAGLFNDAQLAAGASSHAIAVDRPDGMQGISVTPGVLARFEKLIFLLTGSEKQVPLYHWLDGTGPVIARKATQQAPHVELWIDDEAWGSRA